jgi:hypothetical protein
MNIELNREEIDFVMEGLDLAIQQADEYSKQPYIPKSVEWLKKDWENRRDSITALFIRIREQKYSKAW